MEEFYNVEFNNVDVGFSDFDSFEFSNGGKSIEYQGKDFPLDISSSLDSGFSTDYIIENSGNLNPLLVTTSETDNSTIDALMSLDKDIKLLLIVVLCFFVVFVGHGFVNKFRNL